MDAKTYIKNVLVTEAKDFTPIIERLSMERNIRLLHASAGITSEIAELIQVSDKAYENYQVSLDRVNLMEELGDCLWYIGIACDTLDCADIVTDPSNQLTGNAITYDEDLAGELTGHCLRLAEYSGLFADFAIKKFVFYGKPFNSEPLVQNLTKIHGIINLILQSAGYTIEDARERNIAKLKARYGAKFTEAAALERNLEVERDILEGK